MTPATPPLTSTVWPVIRRELQAGARQGSNYWLRVGAGAGAVFTLWTLTSFWGFAKGLGGNPAQVGQLTFRLLNGLLLVSALVVMPTITADCISREKREGTLGLLFLTPLTAAGVVIGKVFVQALRGLTIGMACLPVLAIPFVLGGVTASDAITAAVLLINVGLLGLAAGMIGSALARNRMPAFLWAGIFTSLFAALFSLTLMSSAPSSAAATAPVPPFAISRQVSDVESFLAQLLTGEIVSLVGKTTLWRQASFLFASTLLSLFLLWLAVRLAAAMVQRSWQDKVPSVKEEKLHRRFCTPLFRAAWTRKLNRKLDRNPIAWLQEYSWKARLSKWGLCFVFLVVICGASWDGSPRELRKAEFLLTLVFSIFYTFVGVNSFLTEKKNGALELLLVTPLEVSQIILGRAVGLWKQFLPAALLLLLLQGIVLWIEYSCQSYYFSLERRLRDMCELDFFVVSAFLSLPFFATYFALRVKNLIVAAVLTWVALSLGAIFGFAAYNLIDRNNTVLAFCVFTSYFGLVLLVFFLLHHSLSRRIYAF